MTTFGIKVNDQPAQIALKNFSAKLQPGPLLRIGGQVMHGSIERTFRDQGPGWAPLAASTLKRGRGGAGRKILIQSSRLKNTVTDESKYVISGNVLRIGSNLRYAAIQQKGGDAGRRGPFKKKGGRRAHIPARPYLVFRPEDPQRIGDAMQRYIDASAAAEGLKG